MDASFQPMMGWVDDLDFLPGEDFVQGTLLLPVNDTLVLYFSARASLTGAGYGSYHYFDVNPSLNGGLGLVSPFYLQIADSVTEHLAAVRHADGKTWWLLSHTTESNRFLKWHIDGAGNMTHSTQYVGAVHPPLYVNYISPLVISPEGSRFALSVDQGKVQVFQFDRCSGEITLQDSIVKAKGDSNWFYGMSISPNGRYLYMSDPHFGPPGDSLGYRSKIYQYDLWASNVQSTEYIVFRTEPPCPNSPNFCRRTYGGHKLGPDGKIYIINGSGDPDQSARRFLSVIHNPNAAGAACDYRHFDFELTAGQAQVGLPNIPNYRLGPLTPFPANAGPDREYCIGGTAATLGVPDTSGGLVTYHWQVHSGSGTLSDTTAAQPTTTPTDTTVYVLTCVDLTLGPDCGTTTDTVTVIPRQPVALDAGPGGTICLGEAEPTSLVLGPASGNAVCHWQSQFGEAWTFQSLSDPTSCNPTAKPYATTVYTLVSQDTAHGCPEMRDEVTVTVEPCELEIPNVITPNGDGINDGFWLRNLPPNTEVYVYDRWGAMVYGTADYQNDWVPPASVPEGVYYYRVRVKTEARSTGSSPGTSSEMEKVGTLTLLR